MHDANGKPLKVGDEVTIRARIRNLQEGTPDYCNVTVQTELGRRPDGMKETITLNTGVLEKVEEPAALQI